MEKIKLGPAEFRIDRILNIRRFSHSIAHIRFKTGESIHVICGMSIPDNRYSYPGTYEELKSLIEGFKNKKS